MMMFRIFRLFKRRRKRQIQVCCLECVLEQTWCNFKIRKQKEACKKGSKELVLLQGWPLCDGDRIIIHLNPPTPSSLCDGDSYFCLCQQSSRRAVLQLCLRHMRNGKIEEYAILEGDYEKIFTMDWLQNVNTRNPSDLITLMEHCLIAAEGGIRRMGWDRMTLSPHGYHEPNQNQEYDVNVRPRFQPNIQDTIRDITHEFKKEARAVHRLNPDGSRVKEELPSPSIPKVSTPVHITDVHNCVLHSGAAIYTGCLDSRGGAVIVIFCKHPAWQAEHFNNIELGKLLLYYYTVPSAEVRTKGMTLVVDARGTTLPVLNALLETLYTVEASLPGAMFIVHVLADRVAQSLLFRSSVFRPQVNLKIDLLMSIGALYNFVNPAYLPPQLGGGRTVSHITWANFRQKCEAFLSKCQTAATFLVSVMQEMAGIEGMPASLTETQQLIEQHQQYVQKAFDDSVLREVHKDGLQMLAELSKDGGLEHEDCRELLECAQTLFANVKETMYKLVKLAEERLHRLELCLQLRQYEDQSSQVINWICTHGEEILSQFHDVADNLKGVKAQKKEFEKQYFAAITQIEKGNDMLEEASLLTQSGNFDEVTGIKEVSKELRTRMSHFSGRLEELREKIEDTSKCYHLLDKSYEWALDAMKHVAGMKMEKDTHANDITKLLVSLDLYLKEHPAIGKDTFKDMHDLANKLGNDKLIEQCKVAEARCQETNKLLKVRRSTLQKAKVKMEAEEQQTHRHRNSLTFVGGSADLSGVMMGREVDRSSVMEPQRSAGTPMDHCVRRRSYAGKPSAPIYSPMAAAFKDYLRESNLFEYEEYLFNEGLITEDMSDRIVAFLPKGLSDSTLRGSRESLRASNENLQSSNENLAREQKSSSLPREMPGDQPAAAQGSGSPTNTTLNKHNRPHRKMLKKATSCMMEGDNSGARERRYNKSISMVTGSTESLPSMPEEEEETEPAVAPEQREASQRKFSWSPVPVNTHLMYRGNRATPTHHQSMADIRVAEEDIKRRRTLAWIMREMIQTERDYVRSLHLVIENYVPEIQRDDLPQPLRGKRNIIFGNLEKIYEFHSQQFLAELEQCETNPFQVCHCFLQHDPQFYLYSLYNKNKPKSDQLMQEYGSKFFRKKQIELGDRMDLSSYLLKPVQRMGKYVLLLKQIIKECPETVPEYQDLKAAHEMVKFQLRHGNDLLAMDSLVDCDVNLQEQGMLLRQERFIVWNGRKKCLRHVFLFEEMVILSKAKRKANGHDVYVYKNSIKTSDMGMTETLPDSPHRFEIWFRRRTARETYMLQAPDLDVKIAWTREISRLLWKQAIRNREMRLGEMARMGIGSKPCMDLKPSKDNINDRFVNISLSNRVPRTRNSIAVSSFEHLKNHNKRPHSLISVTSSSSSSSNQSSSYGSVPGGAALGQSPLGVTLESPLEDELSPVNNKSYTISSTESGIVADISSASTSPSTEACDAFTQTTLKRPGKKSQQTLSEPVKFSIGTDADDGSLCTDV